MYKNFKKEDWMRKLQIGGEEIPDGLLIYGVSDAKKGKEWFEKYTGMTLELWRRHNIYRFAYEERNIALAMTYGSPMTSELVHIFSVLGTKVILQVGCFGGLRPEMKVGDILIPTQGVRMDGASDWYLSKDVTPEPTSDLANWMHKACHLKNVRHRRGPILTTTAMLAETPLIIQSWSDNGYFGVDLETATTLSVAQYFEATKGAILYLGDHIIAGRHFLEVSGEEERLKEKGREIVFETALDAVVHFSV